MSPRVREVATKDVSGVSIWMQIHIYCQSTIDLPRLLPSQFGYCCPSVAVPILAFAGIRQYVSDQVAHRLACHLGKHTGVHLFQSRFVVLANLGIGV